MAILDEELIRDANEDAEAIRHIRAQMPSSMSALCTDADLQQIIDATVDTLATSDILESQADADGFINLFGLPIAERAKLAQSWPTQD